MTWFSVEDFLISLCADDPGAEISGDFKMDICLGDTKIPISVGLPVDSNGWLVKSSFDTVDLPGGLDDLAVMVGLDQLSTILPPGLDQVIKHLAITDFEIFFSPENKNVTYITLQVELIGDKGSPGKWDIITGKIGLENVRLYIKVARPTDSALRSVTLIVGGTLKLGQQSVPISILNMAGGDEWSMQVINPDGIVLPGISDFAGWFGGQDQDLTTGLPSGLEIFNNILLYSFDIGLNLKEKSVTSLDLAIGRAKPWPLPNLDTVSLQDVIVNLHNTRLPGQADRSTTGSVSGSFDIAGVAVFVSADHPSAGGGWQFKGSTGAGQEIPIGKLIEDLTVKFGAAEPDLPEALADLVLKDLGVSFNTQSKDFKFTGEAELPVSEKDTLGISLSFEVKHAEKVCEIEISVQFNLKLEEQPPLTFDLIFKHEEADILIATYSHGSKDDTGGQEPEESQAINISDLLLSVIRDEEGEFAVWIKDLDITIDLKDVLFAFYKEVAKKPAAGDKKPEPGKPSVKTDTKPADEKKELEPGKSPVKTDTKPAGEEKKPEPAKYLFGVNIGANISLSDLPLVGDQLPKNVGVDDLRVLFATQSFTTTDVKAINDLLPENVAKLPEAVKSPETDQSEQDDSPPTGSKEDKEEQTIALAKGVTLSALLKLGEDKSIPLLLSTGEDATKQGTHEDTKSPASAINALSSDRQGDQGSLVTASIPSEPATPSAAPAVKWIKVQKSLGPFRFDRIGFQYQDQVIWFLLDASLAAGGLAISLDGLGFGSSITQFKPQFALQGLGINFKKGQLEVGGAFLKTADNEYFGKAILKTETFSLSAIGSYAYLNNQPSMFIYAVMDYPLGGPPVFFVTGLAAGFGYNRSLLMPPIEQVEQFPLVQEACGKPPATDLGQELEQLQQYLPVQMGQYFLVAGVKFTSFKMIDSFAMLAVSFGQRLEINLLGISAIKVPFSGMAKTDSLAEIIVAFKASFIPDEGFVGVIAQLTPSSYILDKKCQLTGGLAFYTWFSKDHAGDFVLSVGGYHPGFKVPEHYPQIPRLGMSWKVNDNLSIKGGAYFALTPSMLMAGAYLEATWYSGSLQAWFTAAADFLIAWKPFHYDAHIYVNIGVSYTYELFGTHHITADLGANLHIWGPEFSGHAEIHLWFISFNIAFGAGSSHTPSPIGWQEFEDSFLPAEILSVSVKNGLVSGENRGHLDSAGNSTNEVIHLGVINPKDFSLVVNSLIPVRTCTNIDTSPDTAVSERWPEKNFGIAPMAITDLQTRLTITIDGDEHPEGFTCRPIPKDVPAGLWGTKFQPDVHSNPLVEGVACGLEITASPPTPGATETVNLSNLQNEPGCANQAFRWGKVILTSIDDQKGDAVRRQVIKNSLTTANIRRQRLLDTLGFEEEGITISDNIADLFVVAPLIER
ncbi:MAG TPA: DUF6603 domain-containing protein [Anaerolineales bacterium]|nr:DUF6603 domain-containing protein [Anaerolineales bacterium]